MKCRYQHAGTFWEFATTQVPSGKYFIVDELQNRSDLQHYIPGIFVEVLDNHKRLIFFGKLIKILYNPDIFCDLDTKENCCLFEVARVTIDIATRKIQNYNSDPILLKTNFLGKVVLGPAIVEKTIKYHETPR